jgi:cellulose biosynthesis protein BcsQ
MAKFLSIFNNKGGVGKTSLAWNIADTLGRVGKTVLLIDFDPQCNLSIAMLGAERFGELVDKKQTIRSFLQGFLQNTGPGPIFAFQGDHTDPRVRIGPGDFWLNVYADSLSVGNDLLAGTGIAKFVAIRTLVERLEQEGQTFDYVFIDLPPSFGSLTRSAIYSSDFVVIPCTSDTFSEYCIGLIAQMLPQFVLDWKTGITRFKQGNYGLKDYDESGKPKFAGWIFNGYDTRSQRMLRGDRAHEKNIQNGIDKLVKSLRDQIKDYDPVVVGGPPEYRLGGVEDMNVLVQNSLWQSVPASQLGKFQQVKDLTGGKAGWSEAQLELIGKVSKQLNLIADGVAKALN